MNAPVSAREEFDLARIVRGPKGTGLVAARAVPAGAVVARFQGETMPWNRVPESEVAHALLVGRDKWLVDRTHARHVNHSCAPNCRIEPDHSIVSLRPLEAGEEFSISYNSLAPLDLFEMPQDLFWDERWSFDCLCGSPGCQGRVDGYRMEAPPPPCGCENLEIRFVAGKGRGVFARKPFEKGELVERAAMLYLPASQWNAIATTEIYHYAFSWGRDLEAAAVALGYGSLYNHASDPNAEFKRRIDDLQIEFRARRRIEVGQEISIDYNTLTDWFPPREAVPSEIPGR